MAGLLGGGGGGGGGPGVVEGTRRERGRPGLAAVRSACGEEEDGGCVFLGALDEEEIGESLGGWDGAVAQRSTRSILTFYPEVAPGCNAFSRAKCHPRLSAVKPSVPFFEWVAGTRGWQLRGDVDLGEALVGRLLGEALVRGLKVLSSSVWAGASATRTPLHADSVHALVFQLVGRKRFFLATRAAVREAVDGGRLPRAVLDRGDTEDFCVDGSLDDVHGLLRTGSSSPEHLPKTARGALAVLDPGDCLLLPAGLYHDVECAGGEAALSLTIRFDLAAANDAAAAAAATATTTITTTAGGDPPTTLQIFLRRLAAKKLAALDTAKSSSDKKAPTDDSREQQEQQEPQHVE